MSTRRKLLCGSLTAVIAVSIVAYLALQPRVTVENYHQIHNSMVLADVEALLGKPTGDRIPAVNFLFLCTTDLREEYAGFQGTDQGLAWQDGGGSILVGFRPGGTVTFKRYDPPHEEPFLDKCRRWLASVKQRW